MVEFRTESEIDKVRGKVVYWLVKKRSCHKYTRFWICEGKEKERGREMVYWTVEVLSKRDMGEGRTQKINWLIKI